MSKDVTLFEIISQIIFMCQKRCLFFEFSSILNLFYMMLLKFLIEFTYFQYLIFALKAGSIDNFDNDDILIVICLKRLL